MRNSPATSPAGAFPLSLKAFATTQALAALHGVALDLVDDDRGCPGYVATRAAETRCFDDLAAVGAWLAQLDTCIA